LLRDVGAVVCAAGDQLAPADRRLYALRDVTATVESIPMIAASIMSKKIAEGTGGLVLDVKTGSGAFMRDPERARELAEVMVDIGNDNGVRTRAFVTAMDVPLGRTAGNALEVEETLEVLAGGGPSDVVELTLLFAREMLDVAGVGGGKDPESVLRSGKAMDAWRRMIVGQGGDPDASLPVAKFSHTVLAPVNGVLGSLDARKVGEAVWLLGAGRSRQGESVQAAAGARWYKVPGDVVKAGEPVLTLYTDELPRLAMALEKIGDSFTVVGDESAVSRLPLVLERIVGL
jgi:thymidine phosphorylase